MPKVVQCLAGTDEASGDHDDVQSPRSPSHQPSEGTSSSNGGLWQKGPQREPERQPERQQQSATGTWGFGSEAGDSTGQPTESPSGQEYEKQMLYIQMEFCPRTLKKTLVTGPIEEADAWQVGPAMCVCAHACMWRLTHPADRKICQILAHRNMSG